MIASWYGRNSSWQNNDANAARRSTPPLPRTGAVGVGSFIPAVQPQQLPPQRRQFRRPAVEVLLFLLILAQSGQAFPPARDPALPRFLVPLARGRHRDVLRHPG